MRTIKKTQKFSITNLKTLIKELKEYKDRELIDNESSKFVKNLHVEAIKLLRYWQNSIADIASRNISITKMAELADEVATWTVIKSNYNMIYNAFNNIRGHVRIEVWMCNWCHNLHKVEVKIDETLCGEGKCDQCNKTTMVNWELSDID